MEYSTQNTKATFPVKSADLICLSQLMISIGIATIKDIDKELVDYAIFNNALPSALSYSYIA